MPEGTPLLDVTGLFERLLVELPPEEPRSSRWKTRYNQPSKLCQIVSRKLEDWQQKNAVVVAQCRYIEGRLPWMLTQVETMKEPVDLHAWLVESAEKYAGSKFRTIPPEMNRLRNAAEEVIGRGQFDWKVRAAWLTAAYALMAFETGDWRIASAPSDRRISHVAPSSSQARGDRAGSLGAAPPPRAMKSSVATEASAEPHVLGLIVPFRQAAFLDQMGRDRLNAADARELRKNCTWMWYGSRQEFLETRIAELLDSPTNRPVDREFDVRCVVIELPRDDSRLASGAPGLDQHLAFDDLTRSALNIQISSPFPIERVGEYPLYRA